MPAILGCSIGNDVSMITSADNGLAQFQQMRAYGITIARIDLFYTSGIASARDLCVRAAVKAGLDIEIILNNSGEVPSAANFASWASMMVHQYSLIGIHRYEVLNEVNFARNWDPNGNTTNPAGYVALLHAAYAAIKAEDPISLVIFASPAQTPGDGASAGGGGYTSFLSGTTFVTKAYAAMGGNSTGYFDLMGAHPYTYPAQPLATVGNFKNVLSPTGPSIRSVMIANGDTSKKIWITEFGAPTGNDHGVSNPVTRSSQAEMYYNLFNTLYTSGWITEIGAIFAFNWHDNVTDGDFGLLDSVYVPKPALASFLASAGYADPRFANNGGVRYRRW